MIDSFLSKLEKVKRRGAGQWMACCPVHQERNPSLSIKDDSGTILMHCFGCGAGAVDIAGALGVDLSELFPPKDSYDPQVKQKRKYFPADMVLEALKNEVLVTYLISKDMVDKGTTTPEIQEELKISMSRIWEAHNYIKP